MKPRPAEMVWPIIYYSNKLVHAVELTKFIETQRSFGNPCNLDWLFSPNYFLKFEQDYVFKSIAMPFFFIYYYLELNENKGFYNEVDTGLFNKDIVLYFSSYVIHGIRAASEICNMHRIWLWSLIYAFLQIILRHVM